MPVISVIVPMYQAASTIASTLTSLRSQTLADIEIIVVDDGSTDGGAAIVQDAAALDPRIRLLTQPHAGVSSARNAAMRIASAPLIGFCDADDLWAPEKAQAHAALHDVRADAGLSYSGTIIVDDRLTPTGIIQLPPDHDLTLPELMCGNPIGNGSNAVARRDHLDVVATAINGATHWFDECLLRSEDIDLWCRLRLAGTTVVGIATPLTAYRVRSNSLSSASEAQVDSWRTVMDKLVAAAPTEAGPYGALAMAYQWRWQSRKAVHGGNPGAAVRYALRCLAADPRILRVDPAKTCETICAAAALACLGPIGRHAILRLSERRRAAVAGCDWLRRYAQATPR